MKTYDIAVIGGGFAGCAAALAGARRGAKVILIDKSNALGGAAASCLVNPFMPYSTVIDGKKTALSAGIFAELHRLLCERGAMAGEAFLEEELKYILNELLLAEGVSLLFHTSVYRVKREGGRISSVIAATSAGELEISADIFIDATGDANLTYLAGFPTVLGRESDHLCQPMTLCFRVGNVDTARFFEGKAAMTEAWKKKLAAGELTNPREDILVFKTPISNVLHFNTTRVVKKNPTDPFDVTEAEILARRQVYEVYEFMKEHGKGLENSFIMMTASAIGIRESRMIVGDYVLTEADCRAFTKFPDGIAACNYDIDIHNPEGTGTSHYYFPEGEYYTIPYRSLLVKDADNLLAAGRCISSDHGAQASYRIMPTVCCIGEAAGCAAALALRNKTDLRGVDTEGLRAELRAAGAFIG